MPPLSGINTILCCHTWQEAVDVYATVPSLPATRLADWLVEFEIRPGANLSIADTRRTKLRSAGGAGITITFEVEEIGAVWRRPRQQHVPTEPIRSSPFGGKALFLRAPEGNRLEFWSRISEDSANTQDHGCVGPGSPEAVTERHGRQPGRWQGKV